MSVFFEPSDTNTPVVIVSRVFWERVARTLGSRVELGRDGGPDVVVFNGYAYTFAADEAVAS